MENKYLQNPSRPKAKFFRRSLATAIAALVITPVLAQQTEQTAVLPKVQVSGAAEAAPLVNMAKPASTTKLKVPVHETPASIAVISEEFIRDSGAKNIQDALLYTSGVQSGNYGFDTRGDWAAVRGLDASFYQDGLRSIYGYYNTARTNVYALESIEVLKGPSSVLYGQAELGGIINAVSKKPKSEQQGEVSAQVGSYDRTQIAGDITGPIDAEGKWLYRVVALQRNSETQVDYVADDGLLLMPSLTWRPSEETEVTLLLNRQEDEGQVSAQFLPSQGTIDPAPRGRIDPSTFTGEPGWDRYDTDRTDITLFVNQTLSEQWGVAFTARQTDTRAETREHWAAIGVPGEPSADGTISRTIYTIDRETDIKSFDLRLEGNFKLGFTEHTLAVGVDYQDALWEADNSVYNYGGPINLYNPDYGNLLIDLYTPTDSSDNAIEQTGIYIIDHIEIGKVVVSAALRYDDSESKTLAVVGPDTTTTDKETTGRIGVLYKFDNGISPYISYSEAFVPNLGVDAITGTTLDPTTGEQTEAGIKYLSPANDLSAAFAWFDIEQENFVSDGLTPGGANQTGALIEGWELEVKKSWGAFEVIANYTDMDAIDDSLDARISAVAEQFASVWGTYELANGLRFGAAARYTGDTVGYGGSPTIDSYTLYDAMIGYAWNNWDFSLTGKNLGDKTYISWCRYEGGDCGYGELRTWSGDVRYTF